MFFLKQLYTKMSNQTKVSKSSQNQQQKSKQIWVQCQKCRAIIQKHSSEDHAAIECFDNLNDIIELNQPFLYKNFAFLSFNEHAKGS